MGDDFFIHHRDRRALFGDAVAEYDFGRPGYPERVYDILAEQCGLGAGSRVLEIGPGTGQATRRLLVFGASVTGVELSPELATRLAHNHRGEDLEVIVAAFENAQLPEEAFDLVVAATCFHWIPAEVGFRRCARVLREAGSLALWWTFFGDHSRPDPFHEALKPILRRLAPELLETPDAGGPDAPRPHALDVEARISEIERSGYFGPVHHETIAWTGCHSATQIRALFASYSPWLALPRQRRTAVLDALELLAEEEFGGIVERPYLTPIYIAPKRAGPRQRV